MQRGFTLIEILITLVILSVVGGLTFAYFSRLNEGKTLEANTALVASVIEQARALTLNAKNAVAYGVHLESGGVTLFVGPTYNTLAGTNVVTSLHSMVGIRDITLASGGDDILFQRLTGETANSGYLEVFLHSDSNKYRTISVGATGIVSVSAE